MPVKGNAPPVSVRSLPQPSEDAMRWKQFFTPIKSINADEGHRLIEKNPSDELTILDVRQPGEYEAQHIPGAKLIPLPDLNERIAEVDPNKTTIVY